LPNRVELAIGMDVMVTFNVETDLNIANGSRGEIQKIVLDKRETAFSPAAAIVELAYPPAYVLVKLNHTKANQLEGLEKNVLPLVPLERTFTIVHGNQPKTIRRRQLPLTPAYSFTDYRSQGQTINNVIIDIATPPTAGLTPFNVYVALSRARGRDGVRLLRDFDEKLLMTHPCEHLRIEDERLAKMDRETEEWWNAKTSQVVTEDTNMFSAGSNLSISWVPFSHNCQFE
jgi:ATP-dependent exoDNAse (exonuclease V) alpha subunit